MAVAPLRAYLVDDEPLARRGVVRSGYEQQTTRIRTATETTPLGHIETFVEDVPAFQWVGKTGVRTGVLRPGM